MKTWREELSAGGETLSGSKYPKRYIQRTCTTTITICNIHAATQPHTQEMHSWIPTL